MRRRSKLEGLGRNNKSSINRKLKLSVFSANREDNTTRQTSFILSFKTRFSRKRDFFRKKERKKEKMIPRYVSIVENPRLSSIYSTFESSFLDRSTPTNYRSTTSYRAPGKKNVTSSQFAFERGRELQPSSSSNRRPRRHLWRGISRSVLKCFSMHRCIYIYIYTHYIGPHKRPSRSQRYSLLLLLLLVRMERASFLATIA